MVHPPERAAHASAAAMYRLHVAGGSRGCCDTKIRGAAPKTSGPACMHLGRQLVRLRGHRRPSRDVTQASGPACKCAEPIRGNHLQVRRGGLGAIGSLRQLDRVEGSVEDEGALVGAQHGARLARAMTRCGRSPEALVSDLIGRGRWERECRGALGLGLKSIVSGVILGARRVGERCLFQLACMQ